MNIVGISLGHLRQGRAEPDGSIDVENPGGGIAASFLPAQVTLALCEIKQMGQINLRIKEKRSKYFIPLLIGAVWNIFFGSLAFFNLQLSNSLFFNLITPEAKIIANKTWWFVVIVAGIGYGIVAFANHRFRFFVTIGAIGKMAFFFFVIYLWLGSIATDFAATVVFGDFVWAIYFFYFIFSTREYGYL